MIDKRTQITDNLWLGAIEAVSETDTSQFSVVISVCQDTRRENTSCQYLHFPLADDQQSKERWGGKISYTEFQAATVTLEQLLSDGESVLIHCHHGQNRSVGVATTALAAVTNQSWEDAFQQLQSERYCANPTDRYKRFGRRYLSQSTT